MQLLSSDAMGFLLLRTIKVSLCGVALLSTCALCVQEWWWAGLQPARAGGDHAVAGRGTPLPALQQGDALGHEARQHHDVRRRHPPAHRLRALADGL